jgi:hypothetical protein
MTASAALLNTDVHRPQQASKKPRRWPAFLSVLGIAAAASLVGNPASATVRITDDYGGQIGTYIDHFETVRNSGERVVIDGPCLSACTLVLGIVPQERICVTSRARLGFHAAWRGSAGSRKVAADDGTQLLLEIYPQKIRNWIAQRGGLSPQLKYLRGQELTAMYQSCA